MASDVLKRFMLVVTASVFATLSSAKSVKKKDGVIMDADNN